VISISEPFIRRPVGTTLLAIGLFLVGIVAYEFLPVSSVPNVDFPTIRVSASRPGADPSVMAATVAAPLERKLGTISGVDQITSTSSLGTTSIQVQFSIGRDIDRAARDGRPRSMPRSPICPATCRRCPSSARPIRPRRRCSCWR
jgi:multidrug efflux pump